MKITSNLCYLLLVVVLACLPLSTVQAAVGEYRWVVEGFDWGPAVNKVILSLDETVKEANPAHYQVFANRSLQGTTMPALSSSGTRTVVYAYVSDESGNRVAEGKHLTLILAVNPTDPLGSPFHYTRIDGRGGNYWVDYKLTIVNATSGAVWNKAIGKLMPLVDSFDLTKKYKYNENLTMSYAVYAPNTTKAKVPLIIWLHGGGEGGFDPTVALLGNRAANYASPEIQAHFGEAFVLAPQCPGAWMQNTKGQMTQGADNDIYNEGLMALIKSYVASNPQVDASRIYVGGCSNGGYMALKLILLQPDYFAAAYISALAYQSQYISDNDIKRIKDVPMWFIHAKNDPTTVADLTAIPVYNRLKAAGAKNVHFTLYDHVTDITGFYGGEAFRYNDHWSWIYSHANLARTGYDGFPVLHNGRPVTIMEWMAEQRKKK
jgi:poly(3-hydroxybutyrate) depolymerase